MIFPKMVVGGITVYDFWLMLNSGCYNVEFQTIASLQGMVALFPNCNVVSAVFILFLSP